MTIELRPLSPRPEVLVGGTNRVVDPSAATIGIPGPFARGRMVYALPTNGTGPVNIADALVIQGGMSYPGDAQGNVIGSSPAVWVHRMVTVTRSPETRRLG